MGKSKTTTPQKHVRNSEIINTPTKLLLETGLLAGKSTPEQVEYIDDWVKVKINSGKQPKREFQCQFSPRF